MVLVGFGEGGGNWLRRVYEDDGGEAQGCCGARLGELRVVAKKAGADQRRRGS